MRTFALVLVLFVLTAPTQAAAYSATTIRSQVSHTSSSRRAAKPEVLPFIADDYARAIATARARSAPIFVDAWAPW
jgi:ribosome-binding protein aMBF1 (putative translation factor)